MARYGGEHRLPEIDWRNYSRDSEHDKAFNALLATSDALPEGEVVGAMLQFQVADNYAWYLVTKRSPLTLRHVVHLPGYSIPDAHLRGLNLKDVEWQLERRRSFTALVAKRKADGK